MVSPVIILSRLAAPGSQRMGETKILSLGMPGGGGGGIPPPPPPPKKKKKGKKEVNARGRWFQFTFSPVNR